MISDAAKISFPRSAWECNLRRSEPVNLLVAELVRVQNFPRKLNSDEFSDQFIHRLSAPRAPCDAGRQDRHSHAERGNENSHEKRGNEKLNRR